MSPLKRLDGSFRLIPSHHFALGETLFRKPDGKLLPKAVASLREVIRLKPDYVDAYVVLGRPT